MSVLAGHAGIELRDDLLPASTFKRGVAEVGRGLEVDGAVEPDVRGVIFCGQTHQERAGHAGGLALAEVSLGVEQLPDMSATADGAGVLGKRRKAFIGEGCWCRQGLLFLA
ncbi:hypothetical protein D3C81_1718640 [compost metagenome]